jgi:hypothetical protein
LRAPITPLVIGICSWLVLAGCADPQPGSAQPGEAAGTPTNGSPPRSTSETKSSTASPLDAIDPCELLSEADRTRLKLEPGKAKKTGQNRACDWISTDVWAVGIGLRTNLAFKDANLRGATPTQASVGRHEAYEVRNAGGGEACEIFIVIGERSFVQVTANTTGGSNTPLACKVSNDVAKIVDPKLP